MNKKIVYFKQKIEKKEKEIQEDKKLIEKLIHSNESIKKVKNKDLSELINNLKSSYKTFKDKIEMLYGYKDALEKLDKNTNNNISEGIANYKQVYNECDQILKNMVNVIKSMVKEYGNVDEFVSILCLEEKESWAKQNIGINGYDFRKKIKNARSIDDMAELFKKELDNTQIDINLFKQYDNYSNIKNKIPNKNMNVYIELNNNSANKEDKNVIQIDDNNDIKEEIIIDEGEKNNEKNKKKINDTMNKENTNKNNNSNNENNSEETNKVNRTDKIESLDTNNQSIESINNSSNVNNDNNNGLSINLQ